MSKEEVELLPSGLVSCLLNDEEVRILKISPERLTVRVCNEIEGNIIIKAVFYEFDKYRYEEILINDYSILEKNIENFYFTYVFHINDEKYLYNVRNVVKNYTKYIMLKNFGDENEFSKEMVGYPAELDYEFYENYLEEKKEWLYELNYTNLNLQVIDSVELAIKLDNDILYEKYMEKDIKFFKEFYFKENFIDNHKLFQKHISRI